MSVIVFFLFLYYNDPAPTDIYTLSLHDALPIFSICSRMRASPLADTIASTSFCNTTRIARIASSFPGIGRSEEHTSELQSQSNLVCRLLLEKKNQLTSIKILFIQECT